MIKIKKEKEAKTPTKKSKPYYMLKINYMIGDANGYTSEKGKVSADNPYLEGFCKILKKVKPTKGSWGIQLEQEDVDKFYKEKQIDKEEHKLLSKIVNPYRDKEAKKLDEKSFEYLEEISYLVRSDTEYSFLVYQDFELTYIDEYKQKHKTIITK